MYEFTRREISSKIFIKKYQEPMSRSMQLNYVSVTAFS